MADCTYCMSAYFLQPTTKACLTTCVSPLFANAVTRTCDPCDSSCTTCVTSATNCNACASQHFPNSGSFPTSCGTCDTACNECTAAGNTNCQACATNYYPVDQLPNKCVATCTDHANNFYLDGALCKECASECGTCSGPLNSNCDSCAVSHYEIVGHPSASPMHCLSSCPLFYFNQGWQCKCKFLSSQPASPTVKYVTMQLPVRPVSLATSTTGHLASILALLSATTQTPPLESVNPALTPTVWTVAQWIRTLASSVMSVRATTSQALHATIAPPQTW